MKFLVKEREEGDKNYQKLWQNHLSSTKFPFMHKKCPLHVMREKTQSSRQFSSTIRTICLHLLVLT